ncbi:UNVERIFIED_CONTAM: alcohol dehydrogenase YqhD (iron-dependent ADH family) [Brevibacillus sp. OAP136]
MIPYEVSFPTRVLFGCGELTKIGSEAAKLGHKALLVTGGKAVRAAGILQRAIQYLTESNVTPILYDRIEPNPRTSSVDAGAALAREHACDLVIAIGGGSVMDAAKMIALTAKSQRPAYDYMRGNPDGLFAQLATITDALPIITVPTVAATGSEANEKSVLTHWDTHEKSSMSAPALFPRTALLDPTLTYSVPSRVTAESSADIFSHLFEAYLISAPSTHVQDGITESLIRQVVHFAPIAFAEPRHEEARSTLLWASTLAISPFTLAGRGAGYPLHQLEHPLSGHYDISHGRGLSILALPYFRQIIAHDRPDRLARMGRQCFGVTHPDDQQAAFDTIDAVAAWFARLGITERLADFGIPHAALETLAEDAIRIGGRGSGSIAGSRPISLRDVLAIYEACY